MSRKASLFTISVIVLAVLILNSPAVSLRASEQDKPERPPQKKLTEGEAVIRYLGHSGWAIQTESHFLIFDYWEIGDPDYIGYKFEKPSDASLSNGFINPSEIADRNVFVFVSHAHSDHFDKIIFEWEKAIEDITYIFGWQAAEGPNYICLTEPRTRKTIDDMEILTVNHEFDGIPEAAFLVFVDGLSIYHAGDHGHSKGPQNHQFKSNIDYLAGNIEKLDLAFTPTFGGALHMIDTLEPRFTFPMHDGGNEHQYKIFARKATTAGAKTTVCAAEKRGDAFLYADVRIIRLDESAAQSR